MTLEVMVRRAHHDTMFGYLFYWKIPETLPPVLRSVCHELRSANDQEDCLRRAYDIATRHFRASRWRTYGFLWKFLRLDPGRVWQCGCFAHCTHLNQAFAILLVHSGWFTASDITQHWTILSGFSPHQYVRVRMKDGRSIAVDVWGRTYGVPFGECAHGFNATTFPVWENDK